jgi:hypothetical protein
MYFGQRRVGTYGGNLWWESMVGTNGGNLGYHERSARALELIDDTAVMCGRHGGDPLMTY